MLAAVPPGAAPARMLPWCRRGSGSWAARGDEVSAINHPGRWLSIVGIGEDGLDRPVAAARARGGGGRGPGRRAAPPGARRREPGGADGLAEPADRCRSPPPGDAGPARRRARLGRSLPVGRRRDAGPLHPGRGDRLPAGALGLLAGQPRGSAGRSRTAPLLSLHGRPLEPIIPHLQPGARILALTSDETTPGPGRGAPEAARLRRRRG